MKQEARGFYQTAKEYSEEVEEKTREEEKDGFFKKTRKKIFNSFEYNQDKEKLKKALLQIEKILGYEENPALPEWREKGWGLFSNKLPTGIAKIREVLMDTRVSDEDKLFTIKIIIDPRKNPSTMNFYRHQDTQKMYTRIAAMLNLLDYQTITLSPNNHR